MGGATSMESGNGELNTTTKENETLLAIITAYVQGEDIFEVYLKELKGVVSAIASLQGHLLVSSGPKTSLHKWTGTELNVIAFYDAPLYGWKGQKLLSRVEFHAGAHVTKFLKLTLDVSIGCIAPLDEPFCRLQTLQKKTSRRSPYMWPESKIISVVPFKWKGTSSYPDNMVDCELLS
ncbi:hypothetical protein ZIOFF_022053 [Zingiber officinale]|uniref:Uncharacterized protein n=1 Tax=Zingiber officinale TaxID=94328 RepID=A0A8J5H4L7_ZINOF|nr:hypothetical protein ZIOFF_022053 [Zingiber officinale]